MTRDEETLTTPDELLRQILCTSVLVSRRHLIPAVAEQIRAYGNARAAEATECAARLAERLAVTEGSGAVIAAAIRKGGATPTPVPPPPKVFTAPDGFRRVQCPLCGREVQVISLPDDTRWRYMVHVNLHDPSGENCDTSGELIRKGGTT